MSNSLYGYSQSNNSNTVSLPLADGTFFPVIYAYNEAQSKVIVAFIVASCISLVATVGLLAAIALSAFNTRTDKDPNMFVRTHVVFYFVSLLLSDILQAISSIMSAAWVREGAVVYGSLCTAQGVLRHMSDVGIAVWSLVIASRTFSVFFLRLDTKHYVKWIVLISQWSLIGAIVIGGPATVRTDEHGPYYGIVGDWCWIAANYTFQRIILDYMVAFMSALFAFILDAFVFFKLRGIVRESASSTSMTLVDQDRNEKYQHRLARQMLLFPIAYTVMIVPLTMCRFVAWAGHDVPFGISVFSDFTYLLSGLVHVILFASTRRILPPNSVLPRFTISRPKLLFATSMPPNDFDSHYGAEVSKNADLTDAEMRNNGIWPSITESADPRNPFADPVLPPEEFIIKRVNSTSSDYYISAGQSPHFTPRALPPIPVDVIDEDILSDPLSPLGPAVFMLFKRRDSEVEVT